jgi:hypothetical protein
MTESEQFAIDYEDHQWWFSLQRGELPIDALADEPPCLDMWVFHAPDGELVEVRPVVYDEPREITARRLKDWLARWIYEKASRRVVLDGVGWKVWREPGITVMSRTRGERTSLPPPAGLYFTSDLGEIVFVQEKLTAMRFVTMPAHELVRRLAEAQRDQGWRPGNPMQA